MIPDHPESESSAVISGYFDDALSAAECRDLSAVLRNDPAAALEFARTARVHALLEGAAPPRRAGRAVVIRRRWLGLGAAAALLAAGSLAVVQHFGKSPVENSRPNIVIDHTGGKNRKPLPPGVNLRTVRPAPAGAPVSRDSLLTNYYVHADPNGLTVPEALQSLERGIARANLLNRSELAALKFTAGREAMDPNRSQAKLELDRFSVKWKELYTRRNAAAKIVQDRLANEELRQLKQQEAQKLANEIKALERQTDDLRRQYGMTEPRIGAPMPGPYTIQEYLDICSLYREVRYAPGGAIYKAPAVSTHPPEPADADAMQQDRTFQLPPALFSQWFPNNETALHMGRVADLKAVIEAAKKATPGPAATAPPGPTSLLRSTGIKFSRRDSTVTVTGTQQDLDRWEQVISLCAQRKMVQHFLTTKYVICPPALLPPNFDPATGMILNDEQFQILMRRLSQEKGVELMTAPSIIVRPGQASKIDITHEEPLAQQVAPGGIPGWLGLQQEVLTTCVGETIQVSGMVDLGLPVTSGLRMLPEIFDRSNGLLKYAGEGAKHHLTGFDLWIPHKCTAVFTLDVNTGDPRTLLVCLTAQGLDPAGQPAGPQ